MGIKGIEHNIPNTIGSQRLVVTVDPRLTTDLVSVLCSRGMLRAIRGYSLGTNEGKSWAGGWGRVWEWGKL